MYFRATYQRMAINETNCNSDFKDNQSQAITFRGDVYNQDEIIYKLFFVCNSGKVEGLAWSQILAGVVGLILNIVVVSVFFRRKKIQRKVGNILLTTQAVADLYNTAFNAIPYAFYYLSKTGTYYHMSKAEEATFRKISRALIIFSFSSSLHLFTLISIERYLCLTKPIWHRQTVTKAWILKGLVIVLFASLILGPVGQAFVAIGNVPLFLLGVWIVTVLGLIIVVSVLIGLSFAKARKIVRGKKKHQMQRVEKSQDDNIDQVKNQKAKKQSEKDKKVFRLTLIFFIMYAVFLLAFVPLLVAAGLWAASGEVPVIALNVSTFLFIVTSIINPILILTLRDDFKISLRKTNSKVTDNEFIDGTTVSSQINLDP